MLNNKTRHTRYPRHARHARYRIIETPPLEVRLNMIIGDTLAYPLPVQNVIINEMINTPEGSEAVTIGGVEDGILRGGAREVGSVRITFVDADGSGKIALIVNINVSDI